MKNYFLLLMLFSGQLFGQKAIDIYKYLGFDIDVVKNRLEYTYKYKKLGNKTDENVYMYGYEKEAIILNSENNKFVKYEYLLNRDEFVNFLYELYENHNFKEIELTDIGYSKVGKMSIPYLMINHDNVLVMVINDEKGERPNFIRITTLEYFKKLN